MNNTITATADKPYNSLDSYLKKRFNEKVYKISLESGLTCPNRDGTYDTRGCIFCSASGSGDFASQLCSSITEQINNGIAGIKKRKNVGDKFIAYFQSFTNTYAPVDKLKKMYLEAINHPKVVMLSIATRPDCLDDNVLDLLEYCNTIKPVTVELGLQTIHEKTAQYIRRYYHLQVYDRAIKNLSARSIETVTHVIAGLPFETKNDFLETVRYVGQIKSNGIKLQLLHVLEGTDLATDYKKGLFNALTLNEYVDWIVDAIAILPPEVVIHRLTGDGPKDILIAPLWSSKKRVVLNTIHKKLKESQIYQGCKNTQGGLL